jgi:hypothetical protein
MTCLRRRHPVAAKCAYTLHTWGCVGKCGCYAHTYVRLLYGLGARLVAGQARSVRHVCQAPCSPSCLLGARAVATELRKGYGSSTQSPRNRSLENIRAAFLTQRASSANRAHSCRERFTALLRDAAADDGGLGAVRCRLKTSSLIPWLGTAKSSGTHARALTPACSMPASGSALFLILLQSYGVSTDNSAPLPVSA